MALNREQAIIVAQEARACNHYQEIEIRHAESYGYWVRGRKVVDGQGVGRTWTDYSDIADRQTPMGG